MTKIKRTGDCGNSPKNKLIEDVSVALYTSDIAFLSDHVTDDIRWNIVGRKVISGKQDFIETVGHMMSSEPLELTVLHVAQHGRAGAVDGRLRFGKAKTREFCDVYEFSSIRGISVRDIRSYMIEIKN